MDGVPLRDEEFTPDEVIKAIQDCHGLVHLAARSKLRCSPQTVYNYINRYPKIKEALDNERPYSTDIAEDRLLRALNEGQAWAIKFYLATIGKDRGFVERVETVHSGEIGPTQLTVKVEAVDAGDRKELPPVLEASPVLPESS
jgi:hypothetical protein